MNKCCLDGGHILSNWKETRAFHPSEAEGWLECTDIIEWTRTCPVCFSKEDVVDKATERIIPYCGIEEEFLRELIPEYFSEEGIAEKRKFLFLEEKPYEYA